VRYVDQISDAQMQLQGIFDVSVPAQSANRPQHMDATHQNDPRFSIVFFLKGPLFFSGVAQVHTSDLCATHRAALSLCDPAGDASFMKNVPALQG
jgi:hypothetical protein